MQTKRELLVSKGWVQGVAGATPPGAYALCLIKQNRRWKRDVTRPAVLAGVTREVLLAYPG